MKLNDVIVACMALGLHTGLCAEQAPEPPTAAPAANTAKPIEAAPVEPKPEATGPLPVTPMPAAVEPQTEQADIPAKPATSSRDMPRVIGNPSAGQTPAQPLGQTIGPKPTPAPTEPVALPRKPSTPPAPATVAQPTATAEPVQAKMPAAPPAVPETAVATTQTHSRPVPDCGGLAQRSQLELDKLQVYVAEVNKRLEKLRTELNEGDQKRRQQAVLIDFFEQELQALRRRNPEHNELASTVFDALSAQLPESPVFRVEDNRLIIMTDFTLLFGRGEVSTEGETRLQLIATALRNVGGSIPADVNWRWRVEGHSDSQPLRTITWFPSNWELSAARASGIARYLIGQGIPAERMRVAALGATQPIKPDAISKEDHWHNRRVEIHLAFES